MYISLLWVNPNLLAPLVGGSSPVAPPVATTAACDGSVCVRSRKRVVYVLLYIYMIKLLYMYLFISG